MTRSTKSASCDRPAVLRLGHMDDPPRRLLLGQDVLHASREKMAAWSATVDEWEPVTLAVNFD